MSRRTGADMSTGRNTAAGGNTNAAGGGKNGAENAIRHIREYERLEQGWLDGMGVPVTVEAGKQGEALANATAEPIGPPIVSPEESGGLEFEWDDNNLEASIAADGTITGYDLDADNDRVGESVFDDAGDAASWLHGRLEAASKRKAGGR